ncbi:hypothetical protein DFH28DRAFT_1126301 [Melampsora americana]|nr:hypothetical protein DFH28DRAFT_1126301 [Melampsora americana]
MTNPNSHSRRRSVESNHQSSASTHHQFEFILKNLNSSSFKSNHQPELIPNQPLNNKPTHSNQPQQHHQQHQFDQNMILSNHLNQQEQEQEQQLTSDLFLQNLNSHLLPHHHSFSTNDLQSTSLSLSSLPTPSTTTTTTASSTSSTLPSPSTNQHHHQQQQQLMRPQYLQSDDYLRTHFQSNIPSQINTILNSSTSQHSNLQPHPHSERKVEVDAIKKALSVLSPDTQQNLLSVLLATQSSQTDPQSQTNHPIKPNQPPSLSQDHLFQSDRPFNPSDHESLSSPVDEWNLPHHSSLIHQHDHSQPTSPILTALQEGSFHLPREPNAITPRVSPSLTPLSTYSTSSHQSNYLSDATSICSQASFPSSSAPVELFSPLTSPALRPEGYPCTTSNRSSSNPTNAHLNMPTLINQAAALGLSSHQSFQSTDQILSMDMHDGFVMAAPPRPSHQQSTSYSQQIHHQGSIPSSHHVHHTFSDSTYTPPYLTADTSAIGNLTTSPVIHATSSSTRSISGKQRATRTLKGRPTPHPQNKPKSMSTDDGPNRSKRAKSVTSGSVSNSPVINPKHSMSLTNTPLCFGSNFNGFPLSSDHILGDSPSPVDLMATNDTETTSITSTNATKPAAPIPPPAMSAMTSLSNSTHKRLRPLTPAGIMNLGRTLDSASQTRGSNESFNMELDPIRPSVQTTESMDADLGSLSQDAKISSPIQTGFDQYPMQSTTDGNGQIDYSKSFDISDGPAVVHSTEDSNLSSSVKDPSAHPALSNGTTTTAKVNNRLDADEHKKKAQAGVKKASSGSTTNSSLLPPETRRSSHKIAEQRRRDSLKMCFEDLRQILPPIHWSEDEDQVRRPGEGNVGGQRNQTSFDPAYPNKGISKVALLRRSNEYILTLHQRLNRRDSVIEMMKEVMKGLRSEEKEMNGIERILDEIEEEKKEDEERRRKVMEMMNVEGKEDGNGNGNEKGLKGMERKEERGEENGSDQRKHQVKKGFEKV